MAKRPQDFTEAIKLKVLLWCERHCCLCDKQAGVNIEVAHLNPKKTDIDNAIPLCFDCHANIGHYDSKQPKGRKYSIKELRTRRDQIYELHTRHLVPPVQYRLEQGGRNWPDIGFWIANLGNHYPARARIQIILAQGSKRQVFVSGHYGSDFLWNLNPSMRMNGHFKLPAEFSGSLPVRARVDVTLIDLYEREHNLLPFGWVKNAAANDWYAEPSEEALAIGKRRLSREKTA